MMKFGRNTNQGSASVGVDFTGSFRQSVQAFPLDSVAERMYALSFSCTLLSRNNSSRATTFIYLGALTFGVSENCNWHQHVLTTSQLQVSWGRNRILIFPPKMFTSFPNFITIVHQKQGISSYWLKKLLIVEFISIPAKIHQMTPLSLESW